MARNRAGQYALSLRRDLLADYYDETMDSTCFIQKGWVDSSNPLIFNPEGVTVNKIQEHEILLRDSTKAAWIVGYVAPNLADFEGAATNELTVELTYPQETIPDISTFEYEEYIGKTITGEIEKTRSYFLVWGDGDVSEQCKVYFNNRAVLAREVTLPQGTFTISNIPTNQLASMSFDFNFNVFDTVLTNTVSNSTFAEILNLKDKVYNDNGVYKQLKFSVVNTVYKDMNIVLADYPNITQEVSDGFIARGGVVSGTVLPTRLFYEQVQVNFVTVASPFTTGKIVFKNSNKPLYDAPYKMFCIPVTPSETIVQVGETAIPTTKDRMLQIAASIATGLGSNLYDIQLLPYCPIEKQFELTQNVNGIQLLEGTVDIDYSVMTDNEDSPIGYVF
jgi:hypothetical protein